MDLSKLHMYDFHYNVTKETYGDKATCSSPTPILAYKILCEDICEDMWKQRELFDLSNTPHDAEEPTAQFFDESNKKALGKFKDECDGKAALEFVSDSTQAEDVFTPGGQEGEADHQGHSDRLKWIQMEEAHLHRLRSSRLFAFRKIPTTITLH